MSGTTPAPTPATSTITTIEDSILAAEPMLLMMFASKMGGPINASIQGAITTFDADAVKMLTGAKAALDAGETANPEVEKAVQIVTTGLSGMGISMPSEAQMFSHLQAALADLVGALQPAPAAA